MSTENLENRKLWGPSFYLGVGGDGWYRWLTMLIAKSSIKITFLLNIPVYVFERIKGIPGLLAINADTLIFRLDSPYIREIETAKRIFSDTIGATWCLLTGPLTVVSINVVFHPINYVLFIHTFIINKIYNILC